ncbi:MAG: ABC transporter permease [Bulleidia sp.]
MKTIHALTMRNIRMYFKDKGMFLTSLITPMILLVLYSTFLKNIYNQTFADAFASAGIEVSETLIHACSGSQMISSLLSVSCVTVVFCCNLLMVQDRANGIYRDFETSPVSPPFMAVSYFLASLLSALLICLLAEAVCLGYMYVTGWYMSGGDVMSLTMDVFLLVIFGTALSSLCSAALKTQGQASALGTIISAGYGFICGAYMPISQFTPAVRNFVSLLPGTYGTSLLRNHVMSGVFSEMESLHVPEAMIKGLKDSIDVNLYWNGSPVSTQNMTLILCASIIILLVCYVLLWHFTHRRAS